MMWPSVAAHLEVAVPLQRQARGADDLVLAEQLGLLGRACSHLRRPEAVALQRRSLEIRRTRLGDGDALVAESTANLGFALWSTRQPIPWEEAERHYLDGLDRYRRLGLGGSRDAARFTMSLGYMYAKQGRVREAERRYREALLLYDRLPVTEDLYELATLTGCASLLVEQRRHDEAAAMLERACRIIPEEFHAHHRGVFWSLGGVELARGRVDEAERHLREALALECERLAGQSPPRAEELAARAGALRGGGPVAGAIGAALQALDESGLPALSCGPRCVGDLQRLLEARGEHEAAGRLRDAIDDEEGSSSR
jgi:tetratricopeptide (TPR) repeat protein